MPLKSKFLLVILFAQLSVFAQQQYGFEWIRPYQPYYKFKIIADGVYSIDAGLLTQSGINISNLHPERLQIFRNGVEIPLYIHGQADGVFDNNDRIEFFAQMNDGLLDRELYQLPQYQPHPWQSMITDTAVYFLTVLPDTSASVGKRLDWVFNTAFSFYTAEPYFVDEVKVFPSQKYIDGPDLANYSDKYNSSEYLDGEGWASSDIGMGQSATFVLNTPFKSLSGPAPKLSTKIIPTNNAFSGGSFNHHVQFSMSQDDVSYSLLRDMKYLSYAVQQIDTLLNSAQLGNSQTYFKVSVINDLGLPSDYNCLSYIKLNYSRIYDLGNQTAIQYTLNPVQGGAWSKISFQNYGNGSAVTPILFDLTANKRIKGVYNAGNAIMLDSNDGLPHQVYLTDSLQIVPLTKLTPVQFRVVDPSESYEFLMITHPALANTASQYATYRSQRFKTLMIYSGELYDYYTYGNVHPLAVRRFANHLLKKAPVKPQFLLLAGRGYQTDLFRDVRNDVVKIYNECYVPAIGSPASDVMFTNGLTGSGFEADIPTGRIPAENDNDLNNYFQKLKYYEADGIKEWRKNVLHISGGDRADQQALFSSYINNNKVVIQGKSYGAHVISFNKTSAATQDVHLKEKLLQIQNEGISLMTFMGHGSTQFLDVDIGSVSELSNLNRYPLFNFYGCNIGNPNHLDPGTQGKIYSKDYVCAQNKGAIGWLAHSNLTIDGNLGSQMSAFYNQFCRINYGQPIGLIVQQASKQFAGSDIVTKMHNLQWVLQADPATIIYSPPLSDYKIESSDIFIYPQNANALSDSFAVGVIVTNLARATDDTVEISLIRTFPNGTKKNYPSVLYTHDVYADSYFKDTAYIWIKSKDAATFGNNVFEVSLDRTNKVSEVNELNNTANVNFFMPGTGISNLFPINYSIVNTDSVELIIQNNDFFAKNTEYIFELDTSYTFSSPFYKTSGIFTAGAIAKWKFALPQTDTMVYFWRSRLNLPINQGGIWNDASFTYVKNGQTGWAQSKFDQYKNVSDNSLLILNPLTKKIEFTDNGLEVTVKQARWWHGNYGVFDPYYNNPSAGDCISSGIICVKFNGKSLAKDDVKGYPRNCNPVAYPDYHYYAFDTKTLTGQQAFSEMIDSADAGDYFAVFSYYDSGIPSWTGQMRNALSKIGSVKAAAANSYYTCFTLIGKKGEAPGDAVEDTVTTWWINGQYPPDSNVLIVKRMLIGKWFSGSMSSEKIGPAKSWGKLFFDYHSLELDNKERNQIDVIGIKRDGSEVNLFTNASNGTDLSSVNDSLFPNLRLKATFVDSANRTPNQFGRWMVTYQGVPEGTISPAVAYEFYNDKIQQGDSLKIKIGFQNLTKLPFDSLPVEIIVTDANRVVQYDKKMLHPPLLSEESIVINHSLSTRNLAGDNTLQLVVNGSLRTPEITLNNNILSKNFTVDVDKTNPIMDVTFDGYRIMNGDYVSPTPTIKITSKDDNQFRIQNDTSTFSLLLKRPGSSVYERIIMNNNEVKFIAGTSQNNKALLEYTPARFPDGMYSLQVISKDASGNLSGTNAYTIDFNVVGASTITNFFPYPNPCTTNMRFVFTLTGAKPPEDLLVRIMTISGKIIREVNKVEFGNIHIGNNISEWAWDGTDNFGDRLANGVYLYQVLTRIDGESIRKLDTKADKYFIQNTGKIYLMH